MIGAGSGGVRASRISAGHGARVAVIEESRPGGTCVIRGCVPKKLLICSSFSSEIEDAAGYGWQLSVDGHDWPSLIDAKDRELDRLEAIYRSLLSNAGVELIEGRGVVSGPNSVRVGDREITAERILIATGGWPQIPEVPGLAEHAITSNEALDLAQRPDRIMVYGAGYIAANSRAFLMDSESKPILSTGQSCHFADLTKTFAPRRRRHWPAAASSSILNCTIASVVARPQDAKSVTLSDGIIIDVDQVMAATGRLPNTAGLLKPLV